MSIPVNRNIHAVIDIGTVGIRMLIADITGPDEWVLLDKAERPIPLGRDVFSSGEISRETQTQCLQILSGFREMLDSWQVVPQKVEAIATSALREAKNRDTFIDRVALRTQIKIRVIEGIEENILAYLAVQYALRHSWSNFNISNSLIMEIGGGSLAIMLLNKGKMVAAHSLNLGTARMEQQAIFTQGSLIQVKAFLQDSFQSTVSLLNNEFRLKQIRNFIAVSGEARRTAAIIGEPKGQHQYIIERSAFSDFVAKLSTMTVDEAVKRYQITYQEAESLMPGLLIYDIILEFTSAKQLVVPTTTIREGTLIQLSRGSTGATEKELLSQVKASAIILGRKFLFEEKHALRVQRMSAKLFQALQSEHGLSGHQLMLLEVAAILHDIGKYINHSSHHKHSLYLIQNAEVFGLNKDDLNIVANVARYHRKALPLESHTSFVSLSRENRIVVNKLAALLRLAEGIDRSHARVHRNFHIERNKEELVISCHSTGNIGVNRNFTITETRMFESVFGLHLTFKESQ